MWPCTRCAIYKLRRDFAPVSKRDTLRIDTDNIRVLNDLNATLCKGCANFAPRRGTQPVQNCAAINQPYRRLSPQGILHCHRKFRARNTAADHRHIASWRSAE